MLLRNLYTVPGNKLIDIRVANGIIGGLMDGSKKGNTTSQTSITFDDAIVFPGLINSHDHLDFNLYPQLGHRFYNNYVEWGKDIQVRDAELIRNIQKIPKHLRVQWGIYKNLLNGVTTVVNHGLPLKISGDIITVFQNCRSLHSVRNEKRWRLKLNDIVHKPFLVAIHVGEGTDKASFDEINELIRWNLFKMDIVGIHGVAMNSEQARSFKGLVWCPASNFFLVGTSAPVNQLKHSTKILFGTDSTLSASWDLWEHLRMARATHMLRDAELFAALTTTPADVWKLIYHGNIKENAPGDIVIAKKANGLQGLDAFCAVTPESILMVVHKGNISQFDASLLPRVQGAGITVDHYSKVNVRGTVKYVKGNMPELMEQIKQHYPGIDLSTYE